MEGEELVGGVRPRGCAPWPPGPHPRVSAATVTLAIVLPPIRPVAVELYHNRTLVGGRAASRARVGVGVGVGSEAGPEEWAGMETEQQMYVKMYMQSLYVPAPHV